MMQSLGRCGITSSNTLSVYLRLTATFDFIEKQYQENEARLAQSRDALNAFKENHKILYSNPVEQQKITNQRLDYLNTKRVEIDTEKQRAGYVL